VPCPVGRELAVPPWRLVAVQRQQIVPALCVGRPLYVSGDRGFRVDLPPGMRIPVQQWRAKVRLSGVLGDYTLRLRLPDLDDVPDGAEPVGAPAVTTSTGGHRVTSTRYRAALTASDRLVLAARFEQYLTWRHAGSPAPRTARDAAARIGWEPHTVAKRCENLRVSLCAPGRAGAARAAGAGGTRRAADLHRRADRRGPETLPARDPIRTNGAPHPHRQQRGGPGIQALRSQSARA
jgi:hypothetical protein